MTTTATPKQLTKATGKSKRMLNEDCPFARAIIAIQTPDNEERFAALLKRTKSKKNIQDIYNRKLREVYVPAYHEEVQRAVNDADYGYESFLSEDLYEVFENTVGTRVLDVANSEHPLVNTREIASDTFTELAIGEFYAHMDLFEFEHETIKKWQTMINI